MKSNIFGTFFSQNLDFWHEKHFLGWVEFYRYQKFKIFFGKIYFWDKNWTFNIVWIHHLPFKIFLTCPTFVSVRIEKVLPFPVCSFPHMLHKTLFWKASHTSFHIYSRKIQIDRKIRHFNFTEKLLYVLEFPKTFQTFFKDFNTSFSREKKKCLFEFPKLDFKSHFGHLTVFENHPNCRIWILAFSRPVQGSWSRSRIMIQIKILWSVIGDPDPFQNDLEQVIFHQFLSF